MTDLYRSLGVSPRATTAEIRSAYRRLARKYHPDVSASPDASAQFVRINEAYHVLIDSRRRAAYDRGEYMKPSRTFYASRDAEVVAKQREFDKLVDEMIAHERQETAARSHAVLVVVPLFLSSFYVMIAKPKIIEELNPFGKAFFVVLAIFALVYLVKNLSLVLARYTYEVPDHLTSVFQHEAPRDKSISRTAGLVFLVCGYLVSVGLGYVVSQFVTVRYGGTFSPSLLLGAFIYPPIAVLLIGGIRHIAGFLDRS
ncbi:MAG TPA: DnaJ domain-containing protein [Blastocatellia bacterium]|nr:DnaJ domain-containing protein [Blastocatellia bacterium]